MKEDLEEASASKLFGICTSFLVFLSGLTLLILPCLVRFCRRWGRDIRFHIAEAHLAEHGGLVLQTGGVKLSGLQHSGCHGFKPKRAEDGSGFQLPFERGGGRKAQKDK